MLSQRMAAASCLALAGVDSDNRAKVAQTAHADFSRTLTALRFGDPELDLPVEQNADIVAALAEVDTIWASYGPAVQQLSHGDLHSIVVAQLMDLNLPALKLSNAAVQEITRAYGAGVIDPASAKTIDIAGRQRMLSQKMMKEACFVAIGLNAASNQEHLDTTVALFDASLSKLIHGDDAAGVTAPPSRAVLVQLQKVETYWEQFRLGLSLVEPNSPMSRADLAALADQSDRVLREMHQAVLLYVSSG